jgi:hypothetical protein
MSRVSRVSRVSKRGASLLFVIKYKYEKYKKWPTTGGSASPQ